MAVPPAPSPEEVSSALRQRLAERLPGEVTDVEVPVRITGGFGFWIYGLHFGGAGVPAQRRHLVQPADRRPAGRGTHRG